MRVRGARAGRPPEGPRNKVIFSATMLVTMHSCGRLFVMAVQRHWESLALQACSLLRRFGPHAQNWRDEKINRALAVACVGGL
jgi:hypothetical protein